MDMARLGARESAPGRPEREKGYSAALSAEMSSLSAKLASTR